ncbi:MAG: TrkA family potassium uptake protein [candidate division NC10 bacterium]|nr:TrkA family potassium uptake protein [candidate division NC10 bacterium]MBI2114454.1 TrkA family potassium uptake protein [candidate division NC10 bacterium]MBI2457262.1 TrkA family potassium uptake protein [candidate division NC10 bacterium]
MLAVIIGGGRGGSYLARDLQTQGYRIKVVDRRPEVVARLRQEIGGDVICGDGCSPQILDQVGVSKADLIVALTHNDEDNLVVCRLAKHHFHVPRVIARVNNPLNEWLYTKDWGVDVAISQVHLTSKVIEEEIGLGELVTLLKLNRGEAALVELRLPDTSPCRGKAIREVNLPSDAVIVSVIRAGKLVIPRGDTVFEAGDEILAVSTVAAEKPLKDILIGSP